MVLQKEEIYMEQVTGFDDGSGRVCRLKKTLYGLKQAGREWNKRITDFWISRGLKCTIMDPCLFHGERNGKSVLILVYVDDLIVAVEDERDLEYLESELKKEFIIKNLGKLSFYLGWKNEIEELGFKVKDGFVKIYQDNKGAINLAENAVYSPRTKHVDIKYHFIRQAVARGEIKLEYIGTENMKADGLTKAVSGGRLKKLLFDVDLEGSS
jgi:hypothetical protein